MDVPEFVGDNPYYLVWVPEGDDITIETIDLDHPGWLVDQGWVFRAPGELHLVRKVGQAVALSVLLLRGEQGYYVARHIGIATRGVETIAHGIGKKRVDGNEDNLWVLASGQICVGKDVEYFALKGLRTGVL